MSLLGVLNNYNRGNYKLNPVIVQENDYNVYYGGISNGLLWPALHNLPEYIVDDYGDPKVLLFLNFLKILLDFTGTLVFICASKLSICYRCC